MKKALALSMALAMSAAMLAGCGGSASIIKPQARLVDE